MITDEIACQKAKEIGILQAPALAYFCDGFRSGYQYAVGEKSTLLSFEECLREEFLVNTQNFPEQYHKLFNDKFKRAEERFQSQINP